MSSAQDRPTAAGTTGAAADADREYQARAAAYEQATGYPLNEQEAQRATAEGGGAVAWGFTALAAMLMILSGLFSFFVGLTGVIRGSFYPPLRNYTVSMSIHAWGWTHLILGAILLVAGVCLLLGMLWARVAGVVLAAISAIANFVFLPHYPVWALIVIVLDVVIIWALITSGRRKTV